MPRPKKILVTGGAGFLGSHLCGSFLNEGHEVYCLDNFMTGRESNIAPYVGRQGFSLLRHNVIEPIVSEVCFDEIYNMACPASPPRYQADPVTTTKTSVLGAITVLELAKKCNAVVFHASTSEVYGDPKEHPQKETYWGNVNPNGIRSCYDEGKRCAESLFFDYHRMHNVKIKVGRIFNTYGPLMDPLDGRVVSNFIVDALQGHRLTIYGQGEQTRSFCYVDDLIEAIVCFTRNSGDVTGPLNIGNPGEFTVLCLAQKVLNFLGRSETDIEYRPLPADDPTRRKPDISYVTQLLGWSPKIDLDEGLKKTITYFQEVVKQKQAT